MAAGADRERPSVVELLRLLPDAGRPMVLGLIGMAAAQVAVPLAIIATTGRLIGRVAEGAEPGAVAGPLLALAALFGVQQLVGPVSSVLWYRASSRIDGGVRVRAMEAASRPPGVELLEDQAVQDVLPLAAGKPMPFRFATPGGAAVAVLGLAARFT
ncbi:MAG: hypothetical protein M3203_14180, partial [Actinomycetota bacterium]|nr:hypothetical protein [Actinomycetota bacterium]